MLRLLHPRSIVDDPTRAYRAVKYAVRFGFSWDREFLAALKKARQARSFQALSGDRMRRGFEEIFLEGEWERAAALIEELGLLADVLPGWAGPLFPSKKKPADVAASASLDEARGAEARPHAALGRRASRRRVAIELPESPEARRGSGVSMTGGVLLAVLLAADPSPSPAPTPTALPTPTPEKRDPHLIAALESRQGIGMERVALFDDGTLVRVRGYRGEQIVDRKAISQEEIAVVRRVCLEALAVRARDVEDPGRSVLGDAEARRITLEVADLAGGSRVYTYDDLASLPLAVGRARGAMEDLRGRFEKQDLAETKWDTTPLKRGGFLRRRSA